MGSKGQRSERFIRSCDRFKGGEGWGCPCHAVELMNSRSLMVSVAKVVALVLHFKRSRFYSLLLLLFFFFYNLSPEGHLFHFCLSTHSGCF